MKRYQFMVDGVTKYRNVPSDKEQQFFEKYGQYNPTVVPKKQDEENLRKAYKAIPEFAKDKITYEEFEEKAKQESSEPGKSLGAVQPQKQDTDSSSEAGSLELLKNNVDQSKQVLTDNKYEERLENIKTQIDSTDSQTENAKYNKLIENYNNLLGEYEEDYKVYMSELDKYNNLASELAPRIDFNPIDYNVIESKFANIGDDPFASVENEYYEDYQSSVKKRKDFINSTPDKILTYNTAPEWFDNNQQANKEIQQKVVKDKTHGYNPKTGELFELTEFERNMTKANFNTVRKDYEERFQKGLLEGDELNHFMENIKEMSWYDNNSPFEDFVMEVHDKFLNTKFSRFAARKIMQGAAGTSNLAFGIIQAVESEKLMQGVQEGKTIDEMVEDGDLSGYRKKHEQIENIANMFSTKYFDDKGRMMQPEELIRKGMYKEAAEVASDQAAYSSANFALSVGGGMLFGIPGALIGSGLIGTSVYGQSVEQDLKERYIKKGIQITDDDKRLLRTGSFAKAGSEFVGEMLGSVLFRYGGGLIASGANKKVVKTFTDNVIKRFVTGVFGGMITEGGSEALTSVLQDQVDETIYNDEKTFKDKTRNAFNSFLVGMFLGGPTSGVTSVMNTRTRDEVIEHLAPDEWKVQRNKLENKILKTKGDISKNKNSDTKKALEKRLEILEKQLAAHKRKLKAIFTNRNGNISDNDFLINYAKKIDQKDKLLNQAYGDNIPSDLRKSAKEQIKKIISDLNKTTGGFVNENLEIELSRMAYEIKLIKRKSGIIGIPGDVKIVELNTDKQVEDAANEINKTDPNANVSSKNGLFIDGKKKIIYINTRVAAATGQTNVLGHELLHYMVSKSFKTDNASMRPLVDELIKFLRSSEVGQKVLDRLNQTLDDAKYFNEDGSIQDGRLEEYFQHLSDIISKAEKIGLKLPESSPTNLAKVISDILITLGVARGNWAVNLNNGQAIFDFIKTYTKNVNRRGLLGKIIRGRVIRTELKTDLKGVEVADDTTDSVTKASESAKETIDELGKMGWDNINWKINGADYAISVIEEEKLLDRLIAAKLKVPMSPAKTREFIKKVLAELTPHIKNFNPQVNDSLFGWINSQISNKAGNVYNREYKVTQRAQDIDARTSDGALVVQVEADTSLEQDYIDQIGLNDKQKDQYSKLRKDLKLNDSVINKVREAVIKTFGTRLPDVTSKKFRDELQKRYRVELKKTIQDLIGSRDKYNKFLQKHFEAVYNSLPVETLVQMERSVKADQRIFTKSKRITKPTEVDSLISKGLLPKDTNRLSGPQLHTKNKYPGIEKVMAFFRGVDMQNQLGYEVGASTLGTRKDKLAMEIGVELAFDATSETIQQPEVQEKRKGILELDGKDLLENELAIVAKQINRDPNIKFSNNVSDKTIAEIKYLVEAIEVSGIDNVIDGDGLFPGFKNVSKFAIDKVKNIYSKNIILEEESLRYKDYLYASKYIPQFVKDAYKKIGIINPKYPDRLERLHKASSVLAKELGPQIMDALGYDVLGYINRLLDSAKDKGKTGIPAPYYKKLQNLKKEVKKLKGNLPDNIDLSKIRPMNKSLPLFRKIEGILSLKSKKEKLKKLAELQPEIDAANAENVKLAKHIAKTLIMLVRKGKINFIEGFAIFQLQTSSVRGLRALTRLDLIEVREGSQSVADSHSQYKEAIAYYKRKKVKDPEAKALEQLGSKGEHIQPNASTMAKSAELMFRDDVDISAELDIIFENHSQLFTSKYVADLIDDGPGGKTSSAGFNRMKVLKQKDINNIVSYTGQTYQQVLVNREISSLEKKSIQSSYGVFSQVFTYNKVISNRIKYSSSGDAKGMSTFDFDETVGVSENFVIATKGNDTQRIASNEWPFVGEQLAAQGYEFDFSDFNKVTKGRPGPLFEKMKNQIKKYGPKNVFILTARAPQSEKAIHDWLASNGINIPRENVTGLGNSTGEAKAQWMLEKFAEGYNDMYFVDDALPNVKAVKRVLDQLDIKSKVVQAKIKFSKNASKEFNQIIEESQGTDADAVISQEAARRQGRNKGWWRIFVPPSAEDFKGLLYRFLGKGEAGNRHMAWFKQHLLDPFAKGIRSWNIYKQNMVNEYKQLKKNFKDVVKSFNKEVYDSGFTVQDAIRVYLWNKAGFEIPGIDEKTINTLVSYVLNNPKVQSFADVLSRITRLEDGYIQPEDGWSLGSIGDDLNNLVNNIGRREFLAEYLANVEAIFTQENLNKIQALYGTTFKEALENILYRMENGRNRNRIYDRNTNRLLNWINGSIGAIMFINMRSALLQTMSIVNFVNWSDNNIFKASAAFANQVQFWKDFAMLFNSPQLKQRRAGIQIDVSASELSRAFADGKGSYKNVINWLLQKGFLPTQIADSFAIAFGGAMFFRNRYNTYKKQGLSDAKAKEKAMLDFQEVAEETQQSSREDLISQQQASVLGRLVLAFQNVTMQMTRLMKKALSDLVNRRKVPGLTQRQSDMTHISKIIYYGAIQNVIFASLQNALAFLLFGEDEDEELIDEKVQSALNSALDSLLRGTGIYGASISTIKNTIIRWQSEREKSRGARDDGRIILEILNYSPPIGSKLRKIYQAIKTDSYNMQEISDEIGVRIENPKLYFIASLIEATLNIPAQRLVRKANNIEEALTSQHALWQRVALALGWDMWSLGIKDEELEQAKQDAKNRINQRKREERAQDKKDKEQEMIDKGFKKIRCSGINSKGKRCSIMSDYTKDKKFLCVHHAPFKDGMDRDGDGIKEYRCTAIKSDGKRCKNKTENKNKRCYAHQ